MTENHHLENQKAKLRFRLACRMLRRAGYFNNVLPGQKRGESPIDWLVRLGLARNPIAAAEALIAAQELTNLLDEMVAEGFVI